MEIEIRQCQNCSQDFKIESDDLSFYQKIQVSSPTWCPDCRMIRRMLWRNERVLYKRHCDLCKNTTISIYEENTPFPVYCATCWRGDGWDPFAYEQEYDFSRTFFEQFAELFNKVPRPAIAHNGTNINSEYANIIQDVKNVYLSFSIIWNCENIYYSNNLSKSKDIFDSYNIIESELLHECIDANNCYGCTNTYWSKGCVSSRFLIDCSDCQNCLGCVDLRKKSYCIFNVQYTKESYMQKLEELDLGNYENLLQFQNAFFEFSSTFPRRYARLLNSPGCSGDDLYNSRNAHFLFSSADADNVKYGFRCPGGLTDSMDANHKGRGELVYEHCQGGSDPGSNLIGILYGMPALSHVYYSDYCGSSSNLFGCIGVRNGSYVIFNKRYEKEAYEKLILKIREQMISMPYQDALGRVYTYGEFFPPELCPFAYNESSAQDFFPKTPKEIKEFGSFFKDISLPSYEITMQSDDIPQSIASTPDSIIQEIIACEKTGRPFRILKEELDFYRKMNIALPRLHPDERYKSRILKRNPLKLWQRSCMCDKSNHSHGNTPCSNEFQTAYAPERPEIVYCEPCYQQEVL